MLPEDIRSLIAGMLARYSIIDRLIDHIDRIQVIREWLEIGAVPWRPMQ